MSRSKGVDSLFCDRNVPFVVLLLVIEEPGREAVFVVQRIAMEAIVDEFGFCLFPIDQLLSEGNSLWCVKAKSYSACK